MHIHARKFNIWQILGFAGKIVYTQIKIKFHLLCETSLKNNYILVGTETQLILSTFPLQVMHINFPHDVRHNKREKYGMMRARG